MAASRIKKTYSGPILKKIEVPLSDQVLRQIGKILVTTFAMEAKKDFAKRGWTGDAWGGSKPVWESFTYKISGERTVEVLSSYPQLDRLTREDVPPHPMTWLTQQARGSSKKRLVVPLKSEDGTVVFRMAPLSMADAWVHPGIAKFTFAERAQRKARLKCAEVIKEFAIRYLLGATI